MRYAVAILSLLLLCLRSLASDSGIANVWDYGATNAGDNTAAIQAALDTGRATFLPTGTWMVTTLVITNRGQVFYGSGQHASILRFDSAPDSGGLIISNTRCLVKDMTFNGASGASTNLIRIANTAPLTTLQHIGLENATDDAVYIGSAFSITLDHVLVDVAKRGLFADGYYQGLELNHWAPSLCTVAGTYLGPGGSSSAVKILNSEIDNQANGSPGLFMDSSTSGVWIDNLYSESAYGGPAILMTNNATAIINNVYGNGTGGDSFVKFGSATCRVRMTGLSDLFGYTNTFSGSGIVERADNGSLAARVWTNSPATNTIVHWLPTSIGGTNGVVPFLTP